MYSKFSSSIASDGDISISRPTPRAISTRRRCIVANSDWSVQVIESDRRQTLTASTRHLGRARPCIYAGSTGCQRHARRTLAVECVNVPGPGEQDGAF
jgi:hypothetical protein